MSTTTGLSRATVGLFRAAIAAHKAVGDTFCAAYEAALVDIGGKDWRALPPDELTEVMQQVGAATYKIAVTELGLDKHDFYKLQGGARRVLLSGLPFKFCSNVGLGKVKQAIELAAADTKGTPEARLKRAMQEVQRAKNIRSAEGILRKSHTILVLPSADASPKQYAESLLAAIAEHLARPEVAAKLAAKNKPAEQLRKIRELCRPSDGRASA